MNGRYCTGSQPFKYFMETDPTVPMWVKKIQQNDIETWNTVLNKQDKLTAGKHIIIDNNEISFDHDIDLIASDFQYFPIGNERIWNDLRNYFTTQNGESFSSISITTDTAYMQWQDGLYIETILPTPTYDVVPLETPVLVNTEELHEGGDLRNTYFVYNPNGSNYDLFTYPYGDRDEQGFIDNIVALNEDGYDISNFELNVEHLLYTDGYYIYTDFTQPQTVDDFNNLVNSGLLYKKVNGEYVQIQNGESFNPNITYYQILNDEQITNIMYNNNQFHAMRNGSFSHIIYMMSVGSQYSAFAQYDDDDKPIYRTTEIIVTTKTYTKVLSTDIFDNTKTYCVYNRKTDTYSTISLNENTFKERQNGLYIRTSVWNKDTLLTSKNIDQLMYDLVDTAYAHAKDTAYQNFVTNQLKDYVNGRIASLNLNTYATNTALNNLITRFNILANQVNDIDDEVGDISSTREYLITTGNGLKKTYINEGTLNQVAHLDLDIRPMPDGYLNEETKKYLHLEDGYNGFYIFNDLIYQDWIYKLTPQGDYIPDGEGGWQKEQLDHYVIGMPFTERLVPARVAVSSKAVLEELNDNYEMKLITLGSNVQIVDLAYYKQLWGATGATFTEADFKALTAEWYDVNWDYDTPENQAIMKMYTYNGENGERLYRHQRAITFIPSESGDIYSADVYTAISDPTESDFNNRTEPWYTYDSVNDMYYYVSLDAEFDSEETYYTLGSQQSKYTIPSCDGVAKFVESLDLDYTDGKVYLSIIERPNTINARKVDIDNVTIVDDSAVNSNNTWSSNKISTELAKYVTLATTQTITGNKTFSGSNTFSNVNTFTNQIVLQGINSMIVGSPDGLTKKALLQRTSLNNTNLIVLGNTSDTLELRGIGTRPTYNSNEPLALLSDVTSLPEPMIFKGTVGSGGTVEWSNLDSASASNKGWTYKVITDHNTAPICKVGDTIISDSTTWVVIPSGDEPSGTVTNIATASESNSHLTLTTTNNNPITSTGTITAGVESGYSIPSTTKQTEWDSKIAGVQLNSVDLTKDANNKVNVIVPQVYRFV